jgi:hypothetical protein
MPILGITASSILKVSDTGAMFPLQVITVGPSGASSVTFSNIPNTYSHLQIRAIGRTSASEADGDSFKIRFNSDSGNNYTEHRLIGTGSAAAAGAGTSQSNAFGYQLPSSSQLASSFGLFVMDVLDYKNTNKYKTLRGLGGFETNSVGRVGFWSSVWMNTNAISSITITPNVGANFAQYSSFALYGIKAA